MASLAPWEIRFEDIELHHKIGGGSFSEIFIGTWKGTKVAVKKLLCQNFSKKAIQEFKYYAGLMRDLNHPNVLKLFCAVSEPPNMCLIVELMDRGSLYDVLQNKEEKMPFSRITQIGYDVAVGMRYLNSRTPPILHNDLKSSNVLIDKWNVRVADFGMSRVKSETQSRNKLGGGVINWVAPEILNGCENTQKSDVYSYGMILWELITREVPFAGLKERTISSMVADNGDRPNIPADTPETWKKLIQWCWQQEPEKRPIFTDIVKYYEEQRLVQH